MLMFNLTKEDMEDDADDTKVIILKALVRDNLLSSSVADKWAESHTIILRKKNIFRTLSDKFKKEGEEETTHYLLVVKII